MSTSEQQSLCILWPPYRLVIGDVDKKDLIILMNFVMMSQHHVASNHQQLACLLNSLFRLTAPSKHHLCITGPLLEECLH